MSTTHEWNLEKLQEQMEYVERVKKLLAERYDHPPLAYTKTFGCQQNASDGEKIKGLLVQMGYGFIDSPEDADLVIYNTCAVRENAEDRVLGHVGALKPVKAARAGMLIGLCGCMMQQEHVAERIRQSYPHVDLVFGTGALHTLPELLFRRMSGEKRQFSVLDEPSGIIEGTPLRRDGTIKANLPIMYGCDNFCTYCIVPYVRGRERSRLPAEILREAEELVGAGYREITLLGQNVNSFGKGLEEQVDFSDLLEKIDRIDGEFIIRFMTSHPKDCTTKLIDTIAASEKICRHIHLPVQSGSNRVLREMNRRYTVEDYLALIEYARACMPGVTFSSDLIVGFPGETHTDFEETLALIRKVRYSGLFTFIYSPRAGTPAAKLPDPTPAEEKSTRMRTLLDAQAEIRASLQQERIGTMLRVLVDGVGKSGEGWLAARSASNDIVEFEGPHDLVGRFADVRIDRALNWAAFGTWVPTI